MEIEIEFTQAALTAQVENLAATAFAHHELKKESGNTWLCQSPDSPKYSFRVIFCPKYVMLCGDIAPQMLFCHKDDSLKWLLEFAPRAEALFGSPQINKPAFFVKDAISTCIDKCREAAEELLPEESSHWAALLAKFKHEMARGEDAFESWRYASHLVFQFDKNVERVGVGFSSDMLWQQQALLTFVRLYTQKLAHITVSRL